MGWCVFVSTQSCSSCFHGSVFIELRKRINIYTAIVLACAIVVMGMIITASFLQGLVSDLLLVGSIIVSLFWCVMFSVRAKAVTRKFYYFYSDENHREFHCHTTPPIQIDENDHFWTWTTKGVAKKVPKPDNFYHVASDIICLGFNRITGRAEATILPQDPLNTAKFDGYKILKIEPANHTSCVNDVILQFGEERSDCLGKVSLIISTMIDYLQGFKSSTGIDARMHGMIGSEEANPKLREKMKEEQIQLKQSKEDLTQSNQLIEETGTRLQSLATKILESRSKYRSPVIKEIRMEIESILLEVSEKQADKKKAGEPISQTEAA